MSEKVACYACQTAIETENESLEHIIPNGIGGRLKSPRLLCKTCNNTFGTKYEAKFVEELRFFSGRLPIKRERGENKKFYTVDKKTGLPVVVDDQGKITLAHIVMLEKPDPKKGGQLKFLAPDQKSADQVIEKYKKKFPNAKIDVAAQAAPPEQPNAHIEINGGFGSLSFFKTSLKCLFNLYIHEGGLAAHVREQADELFFTEKNPQIWFYSDGQPRNPNMNLPHILAIFGRPDESLLFGYAEFFGGIRLIGILNDKYQGPAVYSTHSVDPIQGIVQKCDVSVGLDRQAILNLVNDKKFNTDEISAQLGAAESSIKNNHYFSNLIDGAMQKTILKTENMGKIITPEMISELTEEVVQALMPNILAASEKRRKQAEEDFKKLIKKKPKDKK